VAVGMGVVYKTEDSELGPFCRAEVGARLRSRALKEKMPVIRMDSGHCCLFHDISCQTRH
jgi:hypothetical protein